MSKMMIELPVNIGEFRYILWQGKIKKVEIFRIAISINEHGRIIYRLNLNFLENHNVRVGGLNEFILEKSNILYDTQEEAGVAWLKAQGMDVGLKPQ